MSVDAGLSMLPPPTLYLPDMFERNRVKALNRINTRDASSLARGAGEEAVRSQLCTLSPPLIRELQASIV